jgi:hypothetical protein
VERAVDGLWPITGLQVTSQKKVTLNLPKTYLVAGTPLCLCWGRGNTHPCLLPEIYLKATCPLRHLYG